MSFAKRRRVGFERRIFCRTGKLIVSRPNWVVIFGPEYYPYSFNYSQLPTGRFPIVQVRITNPNNQSLGLILRRSDSGAERSIFDGSLISALEIELVNNTVSRTVYNW